MGDAAIKFTETRVGGIARKELLKYIQEEECMGKSDEEERRQELKNSLEEITFQFRDELSGSDANLQKENAWKDCWNDVQTLQRSIDNDEEYENWPADVYAKQLGDVKDRFEAYSKWKEDYKKYLGSKKVQQMNAAYSENHNFVQGNKRSHNSQLYSDFPLNDTFHPFFQWAS